MRARHLLLIIILLFGGFFSTQAATYRAIGSGNWAENIWDQPGFPGIADSVIIDGFQVTIPADFVAYAKSVILTNKDGVNSISKLELNSSQLIVERQFIILSGQNTDPSLYTSINLLLNSSTIEVSGNFMITKEDMDTNLGGISIETSGDAKIYALRDMTVELSAANNNVLHKLSIANQSELLIKGNFSSKIYNNNIFDFTFTESAFLTTEEDVILDGFENSKINFVHNSSATSNITGNLQLNSAGTNGQMRSEINLNSGVLNVGKILTLSSDDPSQEVRLHLSGAENKLNVDGGIKVDARHQNTTSIVIDQTSILESGPIDRSTPYGSLFMQPTSLLVFNFDSLTTLPANHASDTNLDEFQYSNVKLVNTSGSPLQLDGPMILDYSLQIDSGIIQTDSVNIIILKENARIIGGNEDAYIDGPIEKRGTSSELLIVPLGNKGIYAPLEISPITDPNTILRMQFFGDPPPIGSVPPDLDQINEEQHWIIDRIAGSPVDVVMHWDDGHAAGVSSMEMDSITAVFLDPVSSEWTNAGRGTVSGGNATGEAGSIASDMLGDPPPIGAVAVTIGTVSTNSVLPVELLKFRAETEKEEILLNWVTTAEINLSHFELERSVDGVEFTKVSSKTAVGGETKTTHYTYKDKSPELGTNYYRLRSVDLDGSENLSSVLSIRFQNVDTPVAVPNPVREQLLIMGLNLASYQVTVEVFNSSGQVLFQENKTVNDGKIELQMQEVNVTFEGTYYIRIVDDARTHNITILKK